MRQQLAALHTARLDAESVIETVRVPLVVLTADLHVISAHQAFYRTFQVTPQETQNKLLYDVGQWTVVESEVGQSSTFRVWVPNRDLPRMEMAL